MSSMTNPAVPDVSATLPSGALMPLLGFGTWQITGPDAVRATAAALQSGYRHIDTATIYANEREVGEALAQSGVPRSDVFVTTKLPADRAGSELDTMKESLDLLGVDQVDLWLIHWPPPSEQGVDVWKAVVQAKEQGMARDIGVSNYSLDQIDELTKATGVTPAVNQIRWSPLLFDRAQLAGHRERGVVLEGYSALRGGTLEDPVIIGIADRTERTPAQVILQWHLQHNTVAIPKSTNEERIASNADLAGFELSADDMSALDALGVD